VREVVAEQRTQLWHEARAGKVTGSELERAINPKKQETYMYEILAGLMTETIAHDLNVAAVNRGIEQEPFAVAQARKDLGLDFVDAGFCVSKSIPGFGLSPDNVVKDKDGFIYKGLEIKCPDTKTHLRYILEDIVPVKHEYQVWAPFIASDKVTSWWFMSYDDRCYENKTFYKEVKRGDIAEKIIKHRKTLREFIRVLKENHTKLIRF